MSTRPAIHATPPVPSSVSLRRPVAVLLSRFPLITETFILREVVEMERQGQPVRLVPLIRESPRVIHPVARSFLDRALFTPFLSGSIVGANLRALRRRPLLYLNLLARVLFGSIGSLNLLIRTLCLFPKSVHLAERLEAEGVDHIHAHYATHPAMAAHIIAALTGIPYSVTAHAHDIFVHRAMLGPKLRDAAFVRAISRFNARFLRRLYPALPPRHVRVIPVGIDVERYRAAPRRATGGGLSILCVAGFKAYKGLPVLVEACRRLRDMSLDFTCTLVGDGPLERRIARLVARHDLADRVRFAGPQPEEAVAELMGRASVLVLPSIVAPDGQMEGIPVVLLEAMASNLPVIASRLSGIPEVVRNGITGVLVRPGDPAELTEALLRVAEDPVRAADMSRAGRRLVERRRLDRSVAALLRRIDEMRRPSPRLWERRLSGLEIAAVGPMGLVRGQERGDSWIARLRMAGPARAEEVIVKGHTERPGADGSGEERARREADALLGLERAGRAPRGGAVPRLLGRRRERLVLSAAAGESLEAMLRRVRMRRGREALEPLRLAAYRCGTWLRWFQRVTALPGPGRDRMEAVIQAAERDLERLAPALGGRRRAALERRIASLADAIEPAERAACGRHGDFSPCNVLVEPDRVTIIDWEGSGAGMPFEDAGHFLVHLEQYLCYPVMHRRAPLLIRTFLNGYLGGPPRNPAALEFGRLAAALRLWARCPRGGAMSPAAIWRRRWLRRTALGIEEW